MEEKEEKHRTGRGRLEREKRKTEKVAGSAEKIVRGALSVAA